MSKTKQKKSSAGKSIAVFFIVFIILEGLLIFGLKTLFKNEDAAPSLGGYSFFLMDTDNMSPEVPKSSFVIAMNGTPSVDKVKSAVLCKNVGDEGTTVAWLQDISSKGDTIDGVVYIVYQNSAVDENNSVQTTYDISSSDVVGIATSRYDTAGKIISFVITPFGMVICLAVPLVMLILLELVVAVTNRTDDGYEAEDYYDDRQGGYEEDEEEQNDNVSLDDFLYGGSEDEVYNNTGKPTSDYAEEFEEKHPPVQDEAPAPRPVKRKSGKPDFVLNIPEEDDEVADPFGDEEEEEDEVFAAQPAVSEEPVEEPVEEPAPVQPAVDRKYYEKASRLIEGDDYKPSEEPVQPVKLDKPATKAAAPVKASASAAKAAAPAKAPSPARKAPASAQGQSAARRRPPQQGGAPRRRPSSGAPARQGQGGTQRRPRPTQSRPAQRRTPHKDANAALEELMQKMAEEQKKLGGDGNKE